MDSIENKDVKTPENIEPPGDAPPSPAAIRSMQGGDADGDDWVDRGIVDVPVKDLPMPEGVSGPEDFNHHISWEDAKSAADRLPGIQEEIKAGKTADDFSAEDLAAGVDYAHGKRGVYDLYYGSDPVKLDKIGDQYDIVSGRHRVYAAKAAGLESIPARVTEKVR